MESAWFIHVVGTAFIAGLAISGTRSLEEVRGELGGVIRSHDDLEKVRQAINQNMLLAAVMAVSLLVWLAAWGLLMHFAYMSRSDILVGGILGAALIPLNIFYCGPVTRRFKAMPVTSPDPEIQETFTRWKREWLTLRLQLSDG